ncbi:hypothetical protein L1D50_22925 [Pseudoalteromonas sp. Isolate6]|uniref:hypothetical protein n=1 Tax=Pseudoalteromonas sp. Isolate6 TaxID=2908527 RepID=UPI001EFD5F90|nr:hypothetical protein [Pseudoalteromonas sp. Isolate6]MCG9761908.1 hypothetical protein [Pseudoalteromonas sp. Isolate6]
MEKLLKHQGLKAKWIQIWGDPWENDVNLDFLTKRFVASFEKKLLSQADKVFYVSELTCKEYKIKYSNFAAKISCIGRSYYKKLIVDSHFEQKEEISIFYPGSLNDYRGIENLCEDIKSYNTSNKKKVKLEVCGFQSSEIIERYKKYDFIHFLGAKSIDEVFFKFGETDLLLFVDNGVQSTQIPGKIFDYYGTNLPILALVSEGNTIIKEFLAKDVKTIIIGKSENIDFNGIFEVYNEFLKVERNDFYSPESVAKRFLNEL